MEYPLKNKINLSYVIPTRNKLPYLKICLPRLLGALQPDEEIVIVDGASSDGTVEYLQCLYEEGRIHQFLSEPDLGEAHAVNKAILMARGELIKTISDDDVYYWPNIHKCKEFLLEHPEIDMLGAEGAGTDWEVRNPIQMVFQFQDDYKVWRSNGRPFSFSGMGIMLRRSSLPLLGLFHPGFVRLDHEYSLKVTSIPTNLAWFTGCTFVRLDNPSSNFSRHYDLMVSEGERAYRFYFSGRNDRKRPTFKKSIRELKFRSIRNSFKILHKLFGNNIRQRLFGINQHLSDLNTGIDENIIIRMNKINKWLENYSEQNPGCFLYRTMYDQ